MLTVAMELELVGGGSSDSSGSMGKERSKGGWLSTITELKIYKEMKWRDEMDRLQKSIGCNAQKDLSLKLTRPTLFGPLGISHPSPSLS